MMKSDKNSLHASRTFLIKERELIMTKKWLSPFWNWETGQSWKNAVVAHSVQFWNPDPYLLSFLSLFMP